MQHLRAGSSMGSTTNRGWPATHLPVPIGPHGLHHKTWAAPARLRHTDCAHVLEARDLAAPSCTHAVPAAYACCARLVRHCHEATRVELLHCQGLAVQRGVIQPLHLRAAVHSGCEGLSVYQGHDTMPVTCKQAGSELQVTFDGP